MSTVLVVDDKELMRDSVATTLSRRGHAVVSASSAADALERLRRRSFDAVVTDLQMPGMDGLELLRELRATDEHLPVVLMTAFGTVETAVAAMKDGAFDYITKPFSGDELLVAVERAVAHAALVRRNQVLEVTVAGPAPAAAGRRRHEIVGGSAVMDALRARLERIAASHMTVLITGESGSGKEVAARWIHEHSPRAGGPFLALNCAALSSTLLESELFGHEKGAFTGADRMRKGRFELAHGGTLLLDEISEIDPGLQAKLLRVLQEQVFERVGSSAPREVDVRIIATSNRDLPAEVARGDFRQDLFYRLNVLPVAMPPLRDHPDDIDALAAHFLADVARREGRPALRPTAAALEALRGYAWPGNVRELQNICERAAVLAHGDALDAELVRPWLAAIRGAGDASAREGLPRVVCDGRLTLDDVERESIIATLEHNNGHRQRSARALGIGVRTLGLKLKKWKEENIVSSSL